MPSEPAYHQIHVATFSQDWAHVAADARLAWINHPPAASLTRLTAELYCFRASSASGVWLVGPLAALIPLMEALPIPEPYKPPPSSPAEFDPLDLNISLSL